MNQKTRRTGFDALDVSLELVGAVGKVVQRIRSADRSLADQLLRAVQSVPLNLSEGRRRAGRDRVHHFRIAGGSADEVRTALRLGVALGYFGDDEVAEADDLADRVLAMTWRLTH